MKRIFLLVFFSLNITTLFSQEHPVEGLVFDKDTKQRLARVYIYNLRTNKGVYNNSKGEFNTKVSRGDTLIAALVGYRVDTVTVHSQNTLVFYLKRLSILLREVSVTDTVKSPAERYKATREAYRDAYRKGTPGDLVTIGGNNGAGAGLSIDALWTLLSREGKNARNLQKILERDYRDMIIDYRFTNTAVRSVTGLNGSELDDFMDQYRPSYYFILEANDYALLDYIKKAYSQYRINPAARRLPPLKN